MLFTYTKALSNQTRIDILKELAISEQTCGSLVNKLPLSQSTVSQHLKELKESGLIQSRNEATKSIYYLNWTVFESFTEEMLVFIREILKKKDIH